MYTFSDDHRLLQTLEPRFKQIEQDSLGIKQAAEGAIVAFRLDGIKASQNHLKDDLTNKRFKEALHKSVLNVYQLLKLTSRNEARTNFFLFFFSYSDEVSFVLAPRENQFNGRLFKMGTMLSGVLSSSMTINLKPKTKIPGKNGGKGWEREDVIAFDARPLILATIDDVVDYTRCRWLVASRNALSKGLRLSKAMPESEIYEDNRKKNLLALAELVEAHGVMGQYRAALGGFTAYVLSHEAKPQVVEDIRSRRDIDEVGDRVREFYNWLGPSTVRRDPATILP